jgi:hypothetical protein
MAKKLVLCDCLGSQSIDAARISEATGLRCSKVYTGLCLDQSAQVLREMAEGDVLIACQQERAQFEALAEEAGSEVPGFVDLRDISP